MTDNTSRVPYIVGIRYRSRRGSVRFHDPACDTEDNRRKHNCLPPPTYPIPDDSNEALYDCDACGKKLKGGGS